METTKPFIPEGFVPVVDESPAFHCPPDTGNPVTEPEIGNPITEPEPAGNPADPQPGGQEAPKRKYNAEWFGKDGSKKFRPGPAMRLAIRESLERKAAGWPPAHKVVAARYGVKWTSLETLVRQYHKGRIDLSDPPNLAQKKEIDLRGELQRSLNITADYEKHLNDVAEALLEKAKKEFKDGNLTAYDQLQLPKVFSQLASTANLRNLKEKGVLQILQALQEAEARRKPVEPVAAKVTEIQPIPNASDGATGYAKAHATIHEVLGNGNEEE